MKYRKSEDRLGLIKINKHGTEMKIIKVLPDDKIIVQFQDEHKLEKEVHWNNFKRGTVKNPYDKIVFGIGYYGEGNNLARIDDKTSNTYNVWYDMLQRCYWSMCRYHSYSDCYVCDEWHCFQTFADWYENNKFKVEGKLHLDKDILFIGNKCYSPDTCLLIPQRINMLFSNKTSKDGLPNGIKLSKSGKYSATYNTNCLGTYDTLDEAYTKYSEEKEKVIKQVAEEYKDVISERAYKALCNYKVDIAYDKNYCK